MTRNHSFSCHMLLASGREQMERQELHTALFTEEDKPAWFRASAYRAYRCIGADRETHLNFFKGFE